MKRKPPKFSENDKLTVKWSCSAKDHIVHFPAGHCTSSDAHYLSSVFNDEFTNEMEMRGYDMKTMKFSICPVEGDDRFLSQRSGNEETTRS